MPKIVICEDHDVVVEGIKLMLHSEAEFSVHGHAHSLEELLPLLANIQPDILLLDLNLKKQDGFAILEEVRSHYPLLKILILTMYEEFFLIEKARKLKANGYLLKNTSNSELRASLHHVMAAKDFYLPSNLIAQRTNHEQQRDEFVNKMHLTGREIEIIKLIAQGKPAKEIANQLFLSLHTVDTHRRNILTKLKLKNIADLVRFAFESHLL